MPPREPIRTYVPQPQRTGPVTERGEIVDRHPIPKLIRWFIWLLVIRSALNLIFALTIGLAPESGAANFILANFDPWPKAVSAEGVFYCSALIYAVMAWRWASRDWRVRWIVMFLTGSVAVKTLWIYIADRASGYDTPLAPQQQLGLILTVGVNLLICGYLAFYPGMADAFKETSD